MAAHLRRRDRDAASLYLAAGSKQRMVFAMLVFQIFLHVNLECGCRNASCDEKRVNDPA